MNKKFKGVLKCNSPNTQCGGRCIPPGNTCHVDDPAITKAITRLLASEPKQLLKNAKAKGFGPVQYITQSEALRANAVYGSQASVFDMKSGKSAHPYIKFNTVKQEAVDRYYNILKADKADKVAKAKAAGQKTPFTLFDRLAAAGIRGNNPKVSTEEKVKIFIRLYMEQNGQSFATGNPVNLNRLVVDHIIPLTAGGKNTASNMVLIESNINYWKKALPNQAAMAEALSRKIAVPATPSLLTQYAKALREGNTAESKKLLSKINQLDRAGNLSKDRQQAEQFKAGAKNKATLLSSFDQLRWAKFNTVDSLNALDGKSIRQLLKAQSSEAKTVRGWVRLSATKEQVELPKADVAKLQIFLTNGGKWKDAPDSWKEAFKDTYLKNQHPKGNAAIKSQYGGLADAPSYLQG